MKEIKAGEIVKHVLDGYGIGIVLVPPLAAGKPGDGKVIEQGGFNELYAKKGSAFHRMCQQQGVRPVELV